MKQIIQFFNSLQKTLFINRTGITGILIAFFILSVSYSIRPKNDFSFQQQTDRLFSQQLQHVKSTLEALRNAALEKSDQATIQRKFTEARASFKRMAVLTNYFNPYQIKSLNGPAIARIESEVADRIIPPQGFQAIEQILYADWSGDSSQIQVAALVNAMLPVLQTLEKEPDRYFKFSKELVYDAIRSELIGITTLGITGFDSPVANQSLPEAAASLDGIIQLLHLFKDAQPETDKPLFDFLLAEVEKTKNYIGNQKNFNGFNRLQFITQYINPLYKQLVETRIKTGIGTATGRSAINFNAVSIFSTDLLSVNFYSPPQEYWVSPERIYLGKLLFSDPILSGTGTRSCASCHKPELAFTDGLDKPYSIDQSHQLRRNTPTVINAGFQTKQFYDSRADILENQLSEVVHNVEEMEGSMQETVKRITHHPLYDSLFKKAYPTERTISPFIIANSISCYIRSLVSLNAPFDQYMRGNTKSLSASQQRGFNLFAGKAKCATCHFIPLFNGVVPPAWAETESEVLGVPASRDRKNPKLDDDPGKYLFTRSEAHRYAFKTPTLRNVALTAPYMHNGVFNSLEEVMEFYNKGGGKGLHIAPEYQTLPFDNLQLNRKEIKDIIAFMRALTDTSFAR